MVCQALVRLSISRTVVLKTIPPDSSGGKMHVLRCLAAETS
jgi:hypothetical protein